LDRPVLPDRLKSLSCFLEQHARFVFVSYHESITGVLRIEEGVYMGKKNQIFYGSIFL